MLFSLHGHRGARGLAPENTIEGFALASSIGVDFLELDIALTADDVVVVTHDLTLNQDLVRQADGAWLKEVGPAIRALQYAELAAYDVGRLRPGSRYTLDFPDQVPQDGARIPTLAVVLQRLPRARFNIEMKSDPSRPAISPDPVRLARYCAEQLAASGATGRVWVQSFDWRGLRALQRIDPSITLAWLTSAISVGAAVDWWDGPSAADYGGSIPRAVAAEDGRIWAPGHMDLTRAELEEAHALGLQVVPWTVNDAADMARLISWGVDGLITDRPDLARDAMSRAGLALPATLPP